MVFLLVDILDASQVDSDTLRLSSYIDTPRMVPQLSDISPCTQLNNIILPAIKNSVDSAMYDTNVIH